jgi:hypothetical protein
LAEADVDRIRQVALAVAQHHEDPVVRACDHVELAVAVEIAHSDAESGEQALLLNIGAGTVPSPLPSRM